LKDYLLLSKFICFDFNTKNTIPIKINYEGKNNNEKNIKEEEKNNVINFEEVLKYKKNLEKMQIEFCDVFEETNLKKQKYECELMKIKDLKEKNDKIDKNVKNEKKEKTDKVDKKEKKEDKKIKKFIGRKMKRFSKKKKK
jgi:hypothetical protein